MQWRTRMGIRVTDAGRKVDLKVIHASAADIQKIVLAFAEQSAASRLSIIIGRAKIVTLVVSTEG